MKVDFRSRPRSSRGCCRSRLSDDEAGKTYNTAQSFAEIGATPAFSCTFSFRVPKGTKLARLTMDTTTVDLKGVAQ